jgi:hypothetical protein
MPFRRRLRTSALIAIFAAAASFTPGLARLARAQDAAAAASGPAPSAADVAEARRHFDRAKEDYGKGAYREAIGELEAAHGLDPTAKDLVFNLGVVHEKLADIDEALDWFHLYTTMTLTATERERADSYIRRLEGAKKELAAKTAPAPATSATAPNPSATPAHPPPAPPGHGRIDAATITAASVAGAALVFAVVMSAKAEDDKPVNGFVTGQDGSYTDLTDRTDSAHREAIIADVGFGVSIAAGITATVLYFARSRDGGKPPPVSGQGTSRADVTFGATPLAHGGGGFVLRGSY